MSAYRLRLSVQIRHPDADLAPLAGAISLVPSWLGKKGERKINREGQAVGGLMAKSYCAFSFPVSEGQDLNTALTAAIRALEPGRKILNDVLQSGGSGNVLLGWFSRGDSEDEIKADTLSAVTSLGLSILLRVYHEDSVSAEPAD